MPHPTSNTGRRRLGRTARQGVADFVRYVQIDQKMLAQSPFSP